MKPLPEPVKSFLQAANVCRIATVRGDGTPHIIPVCPAFDRDSTVYVDVAKDGVTAKALEGNDQVTAIFDEYYDDWSKLKAVILRCRAGSDRWAGARRGLGPVPGKYPQGPGDRLGGAAHACAPGEGMDGVGPGASTGIRAGVSEGRGVRGRLYG